MAAQSSAPVGGHQVERLPDLLDGAGDRVQRRHRQTGLVQLYLERAVGPTRTTRTRRRTGRWGTGRRSPTGAGAAHHRRGLPVPAGVRTGHRQPVHRCRSRADRVHDRHGPAVGDGADVDARRDDGFLTWGWNDGRRDVTAAGVHETCDAYVADYPRPQPAAATEFGISGHDDNLPD